MSKSKIPIKPKSVKLFVSLITISLFSFSFSADATTPTNGTCTEGNDYLCGDCSGSANKCQLCFGSYFGDTNCTIPETTIENCDSYSDKETCKVCKSGFNLDGNLCTAIEIENCEVLMSNDNTKCESCKGVILKDDKTCDAETKCTIMHCTDCYLSNDVETCKGCEAGYLIDINQNPPVCIPARFDLFGCATIDSKGDCILCSQGFFESSLPGEDHKCSMNMVNLESGKSILSMAILSLMIGIVVF